MALENLPAALADLSVNANARDCVTITVENRDLQCPKDLLVSHCKYFKAYFDFDVNSACVNLKGGIDYESAKIIIEGLKKQTRFSINELTVQGVLQASAFLQCVSAETSAADFMLANLSLSNAFSIFLLAINCGSAYLAEQTEAYILAAVSSIRLGHFDSVVQFCQLDKAGVCQILEAVDDNFVQFHLACGWVLYNPEDRTKCLRELTQNVVPEIIQAEQLLVDGLEDHPALRDAVDKSVNYEALPLGGKLNYWECHQKLPPNRKLWPKIAIVCSTGNNSDTVAYRCLSSDKWLRLTAKPYKLKVKSSGSAVVLSRHNDSLYFIGGVANVQMWAYNIRQDSWKMLSPEQDERIRPLVCGIGRFLHVFGGYSDRHKEVRYLSTAAKFDTDTNKWSWLSPMEHSRSGGQACHCQGKIYLFGGLCSRRRVIVSCEAYDMESDSYETLTDLPAMILDFGLVHLPPHSVYIIGGMDPITFEAKAKVYVYDIVENKWKVDFPSINIARKSCACFYDGKTIYVAGGATAELDQLSSVERYCPQTNSWQLVDSLPKGLAASVTAVTADMPVRLMANYRELAQSNVS